MKEVNNFQKEYNANLDELRNAEEEYKKVTKNINQIRIDIAARNTFIFLNHILPYKKYLLTIKK